MLSPEKTVGEPLVSIVMPAWRPRADWFRAAVQSALEQNGCDLELIVVDDGSPEPVAGLLAAVHDRRLRIIRVEHGGVSHARNAGIRAARGAFLRAADSDDLLERGSTARLLRLAEAGSISYGATLVCDDQMRPLEVKQSRLEGWCAEECLLYRFEVRHTSVMLPRHVVDAMGEWDPALEPTADWDYLLRAMEHAPVRGDQRIATYYRRHGGSASASLRAVLNSQPLVVDRYFERHPEQAGTALEREARAKLLMVRAKVSPALGGTRRTRLRLVARAFGTHPRRAAEELGHEFAHFAQRVAARLLARPHGPKY
jgi:hypothetical protein